MVRAGTLWLEQVLSGSQAAALEHSGFAAGRPAGFMSRTMGNDYKLINAIVNASSQTRVSCRTGVAN